MNDKDQRIREIAYFLWLDEGCPEGQADRHWRSAQAIVESLDAENVESEPPVDEPSEYVTPLSTLKRAPSSQGFG